MTYNVISYLQSSAKHFPQRKAVADCSNTLNYEQLWNMVSTMGSAIHQRLACTNKPVVVFIKHDLSDILAFYSIAFSGNFYVPVDMTLPPERTARIFDIIKPAAVIAADATVQVPDASVPLWTQEELLSSTTPSVSPWTMCKDTDLLYVIFTSGSTGEPKGVAISHKSVIDMVEQFMAAFDFSDGTVFGNQAPFDFDVSVKDIFLAAKTGGTLEILEKALFLSPKYLINRLNERKVDTIIWAVPALNILAQLKAFKTYSPLYLKNVMFSGEIMPLKTLKYWMEALSQVRFVNLYGPTEITCNCTYHIITADDDLGSALPIGIPFNNCSVFLLKDNELADGEDNVGEICVSGTCLSMGYYGRPELTEAAFPQNPLNQQYYERIYRTGDLGYYKNGLLYFAGRKDSQIKHMGHRIELTEITLCANKCEGIDKSVCLYDKDATKIILFYEGCTSDKGLYEHLKESLPRYMLPNVIKCIDEFPKTRTGKIDSNALMQLLKGENNG